MLRRSKRQSVPPRQGPGLLGTVARTAVISGTATATSRAVNQAIDQKATQPTAGLQVTQDSATSPDLLTQLSQLAQLKNEGALTEEEFKLAKAKLLKP